jgi:hypothetical protein
MANPNLTRKELMERAMLASEIFKMDKKVITDFDDRQRFSRATFGYNFSYYSVVFFNLPA